MPSEFTYSGLAALERTLGKFRNLDPTPLLEEWEIILGEDRLQCGMRGLDGYGQPLARLLRPRKGKYKGATGPELAPFGPDSRSIANFRTAHGRDGTSWVATGAWEDVLSKKGVAFLPFHFRGEGRLPRRDLAHVSPWGAENAQLALRTWIQQQVA